MLPFILVHYIASRIKHNTIHKKENQYDKISKDVYLGRYPFRKGLFCKECEGDVDLCAELPRPLFIHVKHYCYIPVLDACIPSPKVLIQNAEEVLKWNCPIYVHCMHGHGRSLAFCIVYLVLKGEYPDVYACYKHIKSVRTKVSMSIWNLDKMNKAVNEYKEQKEKESQVDKV